MLITIVLIVLVIIFAGYRFFVSQTKGIGGLKVVSNPSSNVFLNDKLVGKSPYEDKYQTGEYVLKLIPDEAATQASSWQGRININPSVLTYVNRELGASELLSSGEILTLEKISLNETQLAIFSQPDGVVVLLDGQEKGVTPLLIKDVSAGEHDVSVTSPGFISRTVRIQSTLGYKLSVNFQLALAGGTEGQAAGISPTPEPDQKKQLEKPYVVIKDTPTGFLRVRSGPTTSSTEAARVKPADEYPLLEEKQGWYKILYDTDREGWISGRYASKVE